MAIMSYPNILIPALRNRKLEVHIDWQNFMQHQTLSFIPMFQNNSTARPECILSYISSAKSIYVEI